MIPTFRALVLLPILLGCDRGSAISSQTSASEPIDRFSDEFGTPDLTPWKRLFQTERTGADPLQKLAVESGWLTMVPYASTWYQNYRGELFYKQIGGDFVATTHLKVSNRAGTGAPNGDYSLAGLMARSPSSREGDENYVFLSLGSADTPGRFQYEVKTTRRSDSQLEKTPTQGGEARLRLARIGNAVIGLIDDGSGWRVHRRYHREDLPETLQVGLTVYANYSAASKLDATTHNRTVIRNGNPDLVAKIDYVRFRRPNIAASFRGRNFADPREVDDRALLQILGGA